jgi:hypothetical protein
MRTRHYFYLAYLIIVSLAVTAVSFSRYSVVVEGSDLARVARPVLVHTPQSLTLNGLPLEDLGGGINLTNVMPGDVLVYEFDISNFQGEDTNEVLLKYLITVMFDPADTTLPLTYSLEPGGAYPSAGGGWVYLGFGQQITHSYTLTVSWDESETDPMYTNQQQGINIQISSQQADSLN